MYVVNMALWTIESGQIELFQPCFWPFHSSDHTTSAPSSSVTLSPAVPVSVWRYCGFPTRRATTVDASTRKIASNSTGTVGSRAVTEFLESVPCRINWTRCVIVADGQWIDATSRSSFQTCRVIYDSATSGRLVLPASRHRPPA